MKKFALPLSLALAPICLLSFQLELAAQTTATDPGVRGGAPAAGQPLRGLSPEHLEFFRIGKEDFEEAEEVEEGLGPTMNLDSCFGCHSQPATGGTSPAVNPQVAFAAPNAVPPFIKLDGPVMEARFVLNPADLFTRDGGVQNLFTITGREGAPSGCNIAQPNFAAELARNNVIFRIPTPVFGAGLIEQIPDSAILANLRANAVVKAALGITGRVNRNGNDGTIGRFGWKAQNKSLLLFAGEAYNVEMGITNELFQTERNEVAACRHDETPHPNDVTVTTPGALAKDGISSIEKFAFFMRFLAPPTPSPNTPGGAPSITRGRSLFSAVGCASCHTPAFRTAPNAAVPALSNQPVNLYSDLAVHDMGSALADGVIQGQAGSREFRTAPLWGLGQRIFFLHDGRARDLLTAIRAHQGESTLVTATFNLLTESQKQDVLNFLRSL